MKNELIKGIDAQIEDFGVKFFQVLNSEKLNLGSSSKIIELITNDPKAKKKVFKFISVLSNLETDTLLSEFHSRYLSEYKTVISASKLSIPFGKNPIKKSFDELAGNFFPVSNTKKISKFLKKDSVNYSSLNLNLIPENIISEKDSIAYVDKVIESIKNVKDFKSDKNLKIKKKSLIKDHKAGELTVNLTVNICGLYSKINQLDFDNSVNIISGRLEKILESALKEDVNITVTVCEVLDSNILLEVFKKVFFKSELDYKLPGIELSSNLKIAKKEIEKLIALSKEKQQQISIRLIKDYKNRNESDKLKLYTEKEDIDANFEKLSKYILDNSNVIYPVFSCLDIRNLAFVINYAITKGLSLKDYEFFFKYGEVNHFVNIFDSLGYFTRLSLPILDGFFTTKYLINVLNKISLNKFTRTDYFDESQIKELMKKPLFNGEINV